jgi:cytoskeleton protein RodZ
MPNRDQATGLPIGDTLRRTRARQRVDIRTVEADTKVRAKYLRALENEEWNLLPGPAYARGFLRTYAQYLGLDADALVDEYRRGVETSLGPDAPQIFAEPVLEHRLRPGEEPRRPWRSRIAVIAALGAGAVIVLLVLGLTGGSGNKGNHHGHKHGKGHHHHHTSPGGNGGASVSGASKPVTVGLVTHDDMQICLVPRHGRPVIDSQTLISGAKEGPFAPPAPDYRLDLDSGGAITLTVNGTPHPVHSKGPATFMVTSNGIQQVAFKGPDCP